MITRLSVQNYALIEALEVPFAPGLNVLTGETGAGKSLLVDAIGLILGRRADSSVMLDPDRKCIVEAEFTQLSPWVLADLAETFAQAGEEWVGEATLIIRREISPGGRSRAFINDSPVNLNLLKAVTEQVVDLHSQHEGARFVEPRVQLDALDRYAGCVAQAREFGRRWQAARTLAEQLRELQAGEAEARRQVDYLSYQLRELSEAQLVVGEDEAIEQQLRRLEHSEQIITGLSQSVALLSDDEQSLSNQLRSTAKALERLSALDPRLGEPAQQLDALRHQIDTTADQLRSLADDTELDPRHREALSARLDTYNRLKVKFAVRTADELIALRDDFARRLEAITASPERIAALEGQLAGEHEALAQLGLELERARQAAAAELEPRIAQLLGEVGLPRATVAIRVSRLHAEAGELSLEGRRVAPDLRGVSKVQFLISTNPGVAPAPIQQVASGGEVARVLLALKAALAEQLGLTALIFDEIDTGISGEVAMKVGRVLQRLAEGRQLLVITHLAQIASRPGHHFYLYKDGRAEGASGRPVTHIRALTGPAREAEIAKILSGDPPPAAAVENARELLAAG